MKIVGVLDNIRSRYNVGAIFRTADCLGVSKLFLCGITPKPDREEDQIGIFKTALGAEKTVPWIGVGETINAVKQLKRENYLILALETDVNGISLPDFSARISTLNSYNQRLALIVGHEVFGIHRNVLDLADYIIEIPMCGTKRSLNVEVTFAIVAYYLLQL